MIGIPLKSYLGAFKFLFPLLLRCVKSSRRRPRAWPEKGSVANFRWQCNGQYLLLMFFGGPSGTMHHPQKSGFDPRHTVETVRARPSNLWCFMAWLIPELKKPDKPRWVTAYVSDNLWLPSAGSRLELFAIEFWISWRSINLCFSFFTRVGLGTGRFAIRWFGVGCPWRWKRAHKRHFSVRVPKRWRHSWGERSLLR